MMCIRHFVMFSVFIRCAHVSFQEVFGALTRGITQHAAAILLLLLFSITFAIAGSTSFDKRVCAQRACFIYVSNGNFAVVGAKP